MKKSELRQIIKEEIEKIKEENVSYIPLPESVARKVWDEPKVDKKKEILIDFLDTLDNTTAKTKFLDGLKSLNVGTKIDTMVTNMYLHSKGLGVNRGSVEDFRKKRTGYLKNKKEKKQSKE